MKFSITDENKADALFYISSKLTNDPLYLDHLWEIGGDKDKLAEKSFRALWPGSRSAKEVVAADLDAWCKANLTDKQFNTMRLALRKKASRRRHSVESLEIDRDIYMNLNDLAAAADMSMKDYLTMLIKERHDKENPPFAHRASKRRSK